MKFIPRNTTRPAGMTLLELTVVVLVLLSLISILFVGARAWKRGSDRSGCIVNIRNLQQGVRSYANVTGKSPGANVAGLRDFVISSGKYVETEPYCPSGGGYVTSDPDTIPEVGVLYATCPNIGYLTDHLPDAYADW